ncbi:hypothetical protein L6452_34633 [Arctium lappa]|uniref:Uncharacterized protein n=1 Tax=Arctium lappa TaxID=4217 RepID=A0ACB8YJW0_ARCLA|nr:hypothetical protein L6452_34633 [Arctium lappa]
MTYGELCYREDLISHVVTVKSIEHCYPTDNKSRPKLDALIKDVKEILPSLSFMAIEVTSLLSKVDVAQSSLFALKDDVDSLLSLKTENIEVSSALSDGEKVQSVDVPHTSEAQLSLAMRKTEEDDYADDVEFTPIVPSISERVSALATILTEEDEEEEKEKEEDKKPKIPEAGDDLGGDDNDDDDEEDEFFIQHTPHTTVEGILFRELESKRRGLLKGTNNPTLAKVKDWLKET